MLRRGLPLAIGAFAAALSTPSWAEPPPADRPDPPPEPKAKAHVRIESREPARLRRKVGRFGHVVCESPCDTLVRFDPHDPFVLEGGFSTSSPLHLYDKGHRVLVRFEPENRAALFSGITLIGGGVGAALVTSLLLLARAMGGESPLSAGEKRGYYGALIAGGGVALIGIPLLAISPGKLEVLPDPRVARGHLSIAF